MQGSHSQLTPSSAQKAVQALEKPRRVLEALTRPAVTVVRIGTPTAAETAVHALALEHATLVKALTPTAEAMQRSADLVQAMQAAAQQAAEALAPLYLKVSAVAEQYARVFVEIRRTAGLSTALFHRSVGVVVRRTLEDLSRLWGRIFLASLIQALKDADPEELEGILRRLGITNPKPHHVEALWVVLHQGAVWRVAEREHPARYLAAAVRREADRLWREREMEDSALWLPRNGMEVLRLDAPMGEDQQPLANTLPADPLLIPSAPRVWDPIAAAEWAEADARVHAIAARLNPEQRRLFTLVVLEGLDPREAARVVFPSLKGALLDNKWTALRRRLRNIVEGRSHRPRR